MYCDKQGGQRGQDALKMAGHVVLQIVRCPSVGPDCETTWLVTTRSLGTAKRPPAVAGHVPIRGTCRRGRAHISVQRMKVLKRTHPEVEGDTVPAGYCAGHLNCCDLDAA